MHFRLGYRPALDGLRGICVLLVIGHHADVPFLKGGFLGVDGFFVLSGFLITTLLLQEWCGTGRIRLWNFYVRRSLRLLPALFIVLAVCVALSLLVLKGRAALSTQSEALYTLTYANNWAAIFRDNSVVDSGMLTHTWSLSIEEQFYLIWPALLVGMLTMRWSLKSIALVVAGTVVLSGLWRAVLNANGATWDRTYMGSDTRADALLLGCLLSLLLCSGTLTPAGAILRRVVRPAAAAAGIFIVYLAVTTDHVSPQSSGVHPQFFPYVGFTLVEFAVTLLVLYTITFPDGVGARFLQWRPLVKVGIVSYGLYLWHYPIFYLFGLGASGWLNWQAQLARVTLIIVLTLASYRYVEQPVLRLKSRFAGRASAQEMSTHEHTLSAAAG